MSATLRSELTCSAGSQRSGFDASPNRGNVQGRYAETVELDVTVGLDVEGPGPQDAATKEPDQLAPMLAHDHLGVGRTDRKNRNDNPGIQCDSQQLGRCSGNGSNPRASDDFDGNGRGHETHCVVHLHQYAAGPDRLAHAIRRRTRRDSSS